MHHAKVLEFKSHCKTANYLDFVCQLLLSEKPKAKLLMKYTNNTYVSDVIQEIQGAVITQ
jgi:hypothetical protein